MSGGVITCIFFSTSPLRAVWCKHFISVTKKKKIQGAALAHVMLSFTPYCDDKYIKVVRVEECASLLRRGVVSFCGDVVT